MFESSHPFAFFDYFRIPYDVTEPTKDAVLTVRASGRKLHWSRTGKPGRYRLCDFTIAGHVDTRTKPGWRRTDEIRDADGRSVAAVCEDAEGNIFLPFDPGEIMRFMWSEQYTAGITKNLRQAMVRTYYAVRPVLPRALQLRMRRSFAKRQEPPAFPAWPVEHGLHEFYDWLFDVVTRIAGEPVPWVDLWPNDKSWAMVLTHDVETAAGRDDMERLRGAERERGYRSSWNFVPERYDVTAGTVTRLEADGCEVGVHGLRHDGRDIASRRLLRRRLPAMRSYADKWGAVGFRSPATQRRWDLMPTMGFDYDSSYTDTDPYEPQAGGCCTYLPFFNEDLVELPITLPQDHTLFEILGHTDGKVWVSKAHEIRERRGMVLVLVHPDYAGDDRVFGAWRQLLDEFAHDDTVWHALPREVSTWWRERATTSLRRTTSGWTLEGTDRGRIRYGKG